MADGLRHSRGPGDTDDSADAGPDAATLAFTALAALPIGVALLDERTGDILLSTPIFDAFRAEAAIVSDSAPQDPAIAREVKLEDGRSFRIARRAVPGAILVTVEDVTAEAANRLKLSAEARREPLTGLGNRLLLHERLGFDLERLAPGEQIAVLCLDLDGFRAINDRLGHAVGDGLLRTVADRLRSAARKGDLIARVGGDAFAIVQTGQDQPQAAAALATRLLELVGRSYLLDGHLVDTGASIGIALAPADGTGVDRLLENADLALARAKTEGRGACRFFDPAMDARVQAHREMEAELRRALALRQLELAYLPVYAIGTGHVTGLEALLRWRHPERGVVLPAGFLPLAEQTGLIVPIGEWVIRTACDEAARWPDGLAVAVNVSAVQFASRNLVPTVMTALAATGLAPNRLEIEITERVVLDEGSGALDALRALQAMGVRVVMDDFGTADASLVHLRKFPFDGIKIDQSLLRGPAAADEAALATVRAVAAIGRSLGIATIAEGVETREQLARVTEAGCTAAQGYFLSQPLPAYAVRNFLARARPSEGAET